MICPEIFLGSSKDNPMTSINITAAEPQQNQQPGQQNQPGQTQEPGQQNQQPGQQNPQQGGEPAKDKPAQQK